MKNTKIRRFLAILLVQVMCLSVLTGIPVIAADSDFIIENGVLTEYVGSGGDVIIPDGVTEIGRYFPIWYEGGFGVSAFFGCSTITSISVPDSVISITDEAFTGCSELKSITLSNNLTELPYLAFNSCTSLTSITIPYSVTSIDVWAFSGCNNLSEVVILNPEVKVSSYMFRDCPNLKSVTVGDKVIDLTSNGKTSNNQNQNDDGNQSQNNRPSTQTRQEKAEAEWNKVIQGKQYTQRFYEMNKDFLKNGIDPYYYENTIITADVQAKSDEICNGLTTDLEKVTAIHEWVTANIYYDYAALRSGNYPPLPAQTVLDTRKCVCSGYAILTQALCWAQGIPAAYICGGTTKGYHAWNVVELDNTWQWIDACWDTFNKYSYHGGETWTDDYQRNDYFLCPTEFISKDHWATDAFAINGINANLPQQSWQVSQTLIQEEEERLKSEDYIRTMEDAILDDATLSIWAKPEVEEAVKASLVPGDIMNHFSSKITRAEFCLLMVKLVEQKSGMNIDSYIASKGKSISAPFTDTSIPEINAAYTLGIVSGTSATTFNPDGSITRQEAAAMLTRTAKLLGLTANNATQFSDANSFANWARESIYFVSGLTDAVSGYKVMAGMGDGTFAPNGTYSREQAIATALRLYRCAN